MPKIKTQKSAVKRFDRTGTGKLMRAKGHQSHLRRNRSMRAKRLFGRKIEVKTRGEQEHVARLAPYLK